MKKNNIVIEETQEKYEINTFIAHFIKIEDGENGPFLKKGFVTNISTITTDYESARAEALDKAQALIRDLNGQWYFRLMKNDEDAIEFDEDEFDEDEF